MLEFYLSLLDTQEEKSKLEQLYYQYRTLMKYIAFEVLKDNGLAEDAVHESFMKLTRHLDGIEIVDSPKTKAFLVIVVRNTALDILKKNRQINVVSMDETIEYKQVFNRALDNFGVQEIYDAIKRLPDIYRDIIELKVYYELSDKKVADILGVSYQAFRKRLQRARMALKEILVEGGDN